MCIRDRFWGLPMGVSMLPRFAAMVMSVTVRHSDASIPCLLYTSFAEAAEVYRQMNTLGYVSREKLGSSLVEVGADAEYYWSETDFGNNNSPYVKTAFDLYTEAAGLGCAQAYACLLYTSGNRRRSGGVSCHSGS